MSQKQNINLNNVIQPAFYKNFRCIGSKCPINCCYGWGIIGWTENEYEKIINADMSDELRKKINIAFSQNDINNRFYKRYQYRIEYTAENKCPMLSSDNLCMIQRELGEEYLSATCRKYPRIGYACGNALIRTTNTSCVHVLNTLCNDENSMELEKRPIKSSDLKSVALCELYTAEDMINHLILKQERFLFDFFCDLLCDKSRTFETSMTLAAMAAQKLDEFAVRKKQPEKIPEVINALKSQLENPAQIAKLEAVKPNNTLKANFSGGLIKLLKGSDIYSYVFENGKLNEEKWNRGLEKYNEFFADKPFAIRNIALNLYLSNHMPFRDKTLSIFDNFCWFAAEIAVIKFFMAVIPNLYDKKTNIEIPFEVAVSYIDRNFSHNSVNVGKILDYMKAFGANTPAMLLGIIK